VVTQLIDEHDRVVYRKKQGCDLADILRGLEPFQDSIEGLAVESTYNWYWLVDGLMEAGYRVHLVNTAAVQQYEGLKYTDDDTDAFWLAHLLRLGVLPTGTIYPKESRAVRDLLRKRSQLVRQRSAHIISIENLYARNTGTRLNSNAVKRLTQEQVQQHFADPNVALAVESNRVILAGIIGTNRSAGTRHLGSGQTGSALPLFAEYQWYRASAGADDHAGNWRYRALSAGRQLRLVLSLCRQ